jgi:ABC-type transport system involved in multi-copper enzyme maturation permease subunit
MAFLPIVGRELSVASRRRGTYWTRTLAAGVAIAVALWMLLSSFARGQGSQEIGQALFTVLSTLTFVYALLAGVRFTADSLSEEKREGTLGLLFLTDLKGYDVIFGKLAASSLAAFYGLIAVLPVLALPMLMGGVAPGEFGRMALALANTLFFSLAVGMCISAITRQEQVSMAGTFLALLVITAIGPWLANTWFDNTFLIKPMLMMASPGAHFYLAFDANYKVASSSPPHPSFPMMSLAEYFWSGLILIHIAGWVCLIISSVAVARAWQEKAIGPKAADWQRLWREWKQGDTQTRRAFRTRLLETNPVLWLNCRDRLQPWYVWGVLLALGGLWFWGYRENSRNWLEPGACVVSLYVVNTVLKFWIASEGARHLPNARRSGALELLLATPLEVRDILRGHLLALQRQFAGPILLVLVLHGMVLVAGLSQMHNTDAEEQTSWALFVLLLGGALVGDAITLAWVSLALGLSGRRAGLASLGALARVLFLPWLVALITVFVFRDAGEHGLKAFLLLLWFIFTVTDIVFAGWAMTRLKRNFRGLAAQQSARVAQ